MPLFLTEDLAPGVLGFRQNDGDKVFEFISLGPGSRGLYATGMMMGFGLRRALVLPGIRKLQLSAPGIGLGYPIAEEGRQVNPEVEADQDQEEGTQATANPSAPAYAYGQAILTGFVAS